MQSDTLHTVQGAPPLGAQAFLKSRSCDVAAPVRQRHLPLHRRSSGKKKGNYVPRPIKAATCTLTYSTLGGGGEDYHQM